LQLGFGRPEVAFSLMIKIRAALRIAESEEQRHQAKLAALRAAIDDGDGSGIAEDNVFARVREKLRHSEPQ
jgi:Arc/MetJ-type ribon-helix-helix transcriptional regulator